MEHLDVDTVRRLAERRFIDAGLSSDDARLVVDEVLEAELRGRESHGVRLFPEQLSRMGDRSGDFEVLSDRGAVALVDGGDHLGPPVAAQAMALARSKATKFGVGVVGVRNKFTFVLAGYHPRRAALDGQVALAMSVAVSRVAPYGGRQPLLGTNPIAVAVPGSPPFVLDLAMTKIPAADIRQARADGTEIPDGAAIDADGRPTTDPSAALEGAMLPFGGYKGSGLAMAVELLSGALLDIKAGLSTTKRRGMLFVVLQPDFFGSAESLLARFQQTLVDIRESAPANGFDAVLVPGDRANELAERQLSEGIALPPNVAEFLNR